MPGTRWLTPDEENAWRSFRLMKALLDQAIYRDLAATTGLSEPDYDVLSTLTEAAGHRWRASDLAARLLWSSSRLSHQVRRMEERGLVRRQDDPADGRGAFVSLTPKGLRAIKGAAPGHVDSVRRTFVDVIGERDLKRLGAIAGTVIAHLRAEERERVGASGFGPPTKPPRPSL